MKSMEIELHASQATRSCSSIAHRAYDLWIARHRWMHDLQ